MQLCMKIDIEKMPPEEAFVKSHLVAHDIWIRLKCTKRAKQGVIWIIYTGGSRETPKGPTRGLVSYNISSDLSTVPVGTYMPW